MPDLPNDLIILMFKMPLLSFNPSLLIAQSVEAPTDQACLNRAPGIPGKIFDAPIVVVPIQPIDGSAIAKNFGIFAAIIIGGDTTSIF